MLKSSETVGKIKEGGKSKGVYFEKNKLAYFIFQIIFKVKNLRKVRREKQT